MFKTTQWRAALFTLCLPLTLLSAEPPPQGDPFLAKGAAPAKPRPRAQQSLHAVYEVFALKAEDAWELLDRQQGGAERHKELVQWLPSGKARLETLTGITLGNEERARSKVESVDEVIYWNGIGEFTPCGEPRNVGESLVVEVHMQADGQSADVQLLPERVELEGFYPSKPVKEKPVELLPRFLREKLEPSVTARLNSPCYLGSLSRARLETNNAEREMKLAFLTVHSAPFEKGAEAGHPEPPQDREFDYLIYSMERSDAHTLMHSSSPRARWENLQALLETKKARKETLISLTSKPGGDDYVAVKSEGVGEIRYATQYDEPDEPTAASDLSPTSFSERNVGFTVTVDAKQLDGGALSVSQTITQTIYHGLFQKQTEPKGDPSTTPSQPLFETRTIEASLDVSVGPPSFVGTFNPPPANILLPGRTETDRTWLVFLRCTPRKP